MTIGYCRLTNRTPLYRIAAPAHVPYRHDADDDQQCLPTTYNAGRHEVDCIAVTEAEIKRHFGVEVLRVRRDAIDLTMMDRGRIPLLDSHDPLSILGRVTDIWLKKRRLHATLKFDQTAAGRTAEQAVSAGAIWSVSARANVHEWLAEDETGDPIRVFNPDTWCGNKNVTFTGQRWSLLEISLTTMPSDPAAVIL